MVNKSLYFSPFFILFLVPSDDRDLVILEPWRAFEVADQGIRRPRTKTSIVPLRTAECELIYENEIVPNASTNFINFLRERMEDAGSVKRMLDFLSTYTFDIGGNLLLLTTSL